MPAFRHTVLHSLEDAQHNFEQIESERAAQLQGVSANALSAGAWINPESFSAKLEETTTCQVRKEGTSARLKGIVKAKEALPGNTKLFSLPAGLRPPAALRALAVNTSTNAVIILLILSTGEVQNLTEVAITNVVGFDTITYNLT